MYYEPKAPARRFQGDRELRDALASESYATLNRRTLLPFLRARIADRAPSVVVFATDAFPIEVLGATAQAPAERSPLRA